MGLIRTQKIGEGMHIEGKTNNIDSPYKQAERKEIKYILVRAFRVLNPIDARIITEYYLYGNKSDNKIGKDLDTPISYSAVQLRRKRALKKLKGALWKECIESDLL